MTTFVSETIYAVPTVWSHLPNLITTVVSSIAISFAFVSYYISYFYTFVKDDKDKDDKDKDDKDKDDTSESCADENDEGMGMGMDVDVDDDKAKRDLVQQYQNSFYDELEALSDNEADQETKNTTAPSLDLQHAELHETTPQGEIVLIYDTHAEAFAYYTDSFLKLSYATLDAAARRFAVRYKCKAKCVNARQEMTLAKEKMFFQQHEQQNIQAVKSVFAQFKKYENIKALASASANLLNQIFTPEKANRFIYKGSLLQYKITKECAAANDTTTRPAANDTTRPAASDDNNLLRNGTAVDAVSVTTEDNLKATLTNDIDYATYKQQLLLLQTRL